MPNLPPLDAVFQPNPEYRTPFWVARDAFYQGFITNREYELVCQEWLVITPAGRLKQKALPEEAGEFLTGRRIADIMADRLLGISS